MDRWLDLLYWIVIGGVALFVLLLLLFLLVFRKVWSDMGRMDAEHNSVRRRIRGRLD